MSHISYDKRWRNLFEPTILSLTAGFVDTVGFIGLFGLFTNHVTGNLILAGASVAGGSNEIISKLLAIPVFMIAVCTTAIYIHFNTEKKHKVIGRLFIIESLLLLLFMLATVFLGPLEGADNSTTIIAAMFGVSAMGVRITIARMLIDKMPHSTVMTGNVAQIAMDFGTLICNKFKVTDDTHAIRKRMRLFIPIIVAFIIGAALGSLGYVYVKFYSLLLPIILIFFLGVREIIINRKF